MLFQELEALQKYEKPQITTRFHKKNYVEGEEDFFVGINLPDLRKLAKTYYLIISDSDLDILLVNKIHEYRLLGLIILTYQIKDADINIQKEIVDKYLKNLDYVNNWDLVDVSAANILGKYLFNTEDYSLLYELSKSTNLWYKRISIVSTWYLISQGELETTLNIVDNLLEDKHDLIHKACGWMLRELGKKDQELLTDYLKKNYSKLPRTMLRYAIEKYSENIRKRILKGDFLWR